MMYSTTEDGNEKRCDMNEGIVTEDADGTDQAIVILEPTPIARPDLGATTLVPKLIAQAGEQASLRFVDFFTANIRNPNTRGAYAVAPCGCCSTASWSAR
jgi:hypothetical protein